MLSRLRHPLHQPTLARALFSTETTSLNGWTIQQAVAGSSAATAASATKTETVHITPDGKITIDHTVTASSSPNTKSTTLNTKSTTLPTSWRHLITHQLQSTFFPTGYPHTVAPNYLKYVSWQALHHTAGAANGVLASTFLLYSVGLGAGAIPTAGALSWILKDGLGQLGTLLFGRAMAHNFDLSSRSWYVAASGKLNLAMSLEIATALAPQWFLPLGATANAVKGLAWMAGGSSRSAFNVAFAQDRNIADITAKATSQTICTSLLGTAVGMAIAASIEQSVGLCFTWYSALAAVHMYSAVESAKSVPLKTLNPSRLKKLSELYLDYLDGSSSSSIYNSSTSDPNSRYSKERLIASLIDRKLPTPAELAVHDPLFPPLLENPPKNNNTSQQQLNLVVGTSLRQLASAEPTTVAAMLPLYKNKKYVLLLSMDKHAKMHLILHEEAETTDAVTAVLQATIWNNTLLLRRSSRDSFKEESENMQHQAQKAMDLAEVIGPSMVDALKIAGWDVQGVVIEPRRRRATW